MVTGLLKSSVASARILTVLLGSAALLAGCGQKGPLTLPPADTAPPAAPAASAPAAPAAATPR